MTRIAWWTLMVVATLGCQAAPDRSGPQSRQQGLHSEKEEPDENECEDHQARCPVTACTFAAQRDRRTGRCRARPRPDGTPCDDGNACTQNDACHSGLCVGANPVACAAPDACHVGRCDPLTGTCASVAAADGAPCNDGNACTQTDVCAGGACTGTVPAVCAAADACHVAGTCSPATGTCSTVAAPDGTPCNDGNPGTVADACTGGVCQGLAGCSATAAAVQVFDATMLGCAGRVTFVNRASLCSAACHVCSPTEWNTHRGSVAPTFDYWTSVDLGYPSASQSANNCEVTPPPSAFMCESGNQGPMGVCASVQPDAQGNQCNLVNCGYATTANQFFGGCNLYDTSGALCCCP